VKHAQKKENANFFAIIRAKRGSGAQERWLKLGECKIARRIKGACYSANKKNGDTMNDRGALQR
jgi:hypothetical protein